MRRALVLTSEGSRHPFRRMLPPLALAVPKGEEVPTAPRSVADDARLFAASYAVFVIGFSAYLW